MGKKGGMAEVIKVNARDMAGRGKSQSCFPEMMAFMSCLKSNNFDMVPCKKFVESLDQCMSTQASDSSSGQCPELFIQYLPGIIVEVDLATS